MCGEKHTQLQDIAIGWLYKNGCDIFSQECQLPNGDIADVVGVKHNGYRQHELVKGNGQLEWETKRLDASYYIEAKASRSDLICRKQRKCYELSVTRPVCNFYYLIVADGIKVEDTLYPEWGVLNEAGEVVRRAKRKEIPESINPKYLKSIERSIAHSLVYRVFGKLYFDK